MMGVRTDWLDGVVKRFREGEGVNANCYRYTVPVDVGGRYINVTFTKKELMSCSDEQLRSIILDRTGP